MIPIKRCLHILSPSSLFPIAVVLATLSTYIRYKNLYEVQPDSPLQQVHNSTVSARQKNIVWYQLYHGGLRMDARQVNMETCEYKNCKISFIDNKMQEKAAFHSADAVLFQAGRLTYNPPLRASADQVFVFASIESPLHLSFVKKGQEKLWANAINWTMTYRTDSDILYKYGDIVLKPEAGPVTAKGNFSAIFHNKTKHVAWFVSDCKTESLRELFVKKLKSYIDVDIYGQCGSLQTCPKERGQDCLRQVARDYKFYLSFENSLCIDYMTEKVYSWFDMDLVTVVRGARNYSSLLPPGTYIDTGQFKHLKGLATFLKTVGDSEDLYTNYLKLKAQYVTKSYKEQFQKAYCEICKRLHNLEDYRNSYSNIYKWWTANSCQRRINDIV